MTRFGWAWILMGCAGVAVAAGEKTFRIHDSVLLFGNYNEVWIVTAEGERLVRPPVEAKCNGGYFAFPGAGSARRQSDYDGIYQPDRGHFRSASPPWFHPSIPKRLTPRGEPRQSAVVGAVPEP